MYMTNYMYIDIICLDIQLVLLGLVSPVISRVRMRPSDLFVGLC